MKTLRDVHEVLVNLDKQYVHDRDNVFAQMAAIVKESHDAIRDIDRVLRVDAAEFVPAIGDVFTIIDRVDPDAKAYNEVPS